MGDHVDDIATMQKMTQHLCFPMEILALDKQGRPFEALQCGDAQ